MVYSKDLNFATTQDLFGLYASKHAALQSLRDLADQYKLCYGALGLERLPKGKPCFRAMVQHCAGICRGNESLDDHQQRFLDALEGIRVACWPFSGAVGLVERFEDECQIHVVCNWTYLGSVSELSQAKLLNTMAAGFDADGYKILCRPFLTRAVELVFL